MNKKPSPTTREDRLKAALKQNMAKRKAQAKARQAAEKTRETGKDQADG